MIWVAESVLCNDLEIDSLEVEKLSDAGAVVRWNTEHAARAVKTKDLLLHLNSLFCVL